MATRSQRRKEKQKQKRKKKKEEQRKRQRDVRSGDQPVSPSTDFSLGSIARVARQAIPVGTSKRMQRILQQKPQAWPGEFPEDVAVFDDTTLETLAPDIAEQVQAVRDALQLACDARVSEALNRVSGIPRNSPLSEWRLYLRGLVAWMTNDQDAADEAWKRLNFDRRSGRMAIAQMNALLADSQNDSAEQETPSPTESLRREWSERLDDPLRHHAKCLHRARFDRPAIKYAESGAYAREESKALQFGPRKLDWLKRFSAEYRETEPDLVRALQHVALCRAFAQPYSDLFEQAAEAFEGPPHDRRNLLLSFFYFGKFEDDNEALRCMEEALEEYLELDLPKNEQLSPPLRSAIASQIHLEEAMVEIRAPVGGMFAFLQPPEDTRAIQKHLRAAMKAYPENRVAYQVYVNWLDDKLDNTRLTKKEREPLLQKKARVMSEWSDALPDDTKPRLWLVDYLLENEQTEQAKPHVDWLAGSRQENPLVRAAPWKWQLLEAMRLCRRKAWLADVSAHLEEAERLWPIWLSREWLPYLKAAVTLRAGDTDEFERQRQRICEQSGVQRDSLADACMMLGAAQHMRIPSANLKPLRVPVDQAVKAVQKRTVEELLSVSRFFWDLHRTQLTYPAYRMHGGKIVNQLFASLNDDSRWVTQHLNDERIHSAILLCSELRCLDDGWQLRLPDWYGKPEVNQHPMFAAAKLNATLKLRYMARVQQLDRLCHQVREMAQSQDLYYRYWLPMLADELDDRIASCPFNRLNVGFDSWNSDEEDGSDDEKRY